MASINEGCYPIKTILKKNSPYAINSHFWKSLKHAYYLNYYGRHFSKTVKIKSTTITHPTLTEAEAVIR